MVAGLRGLESPRPSSSPCRARPPSGRCSQHRTAEHTGRKKKKYARCEKMFWWAFSSREKNVQIIRSLFCSMYYFRVLCSFWRWKSKWCTEPWQKSEYKMMQNLRKIMKNLDFSRWFHTVCTPRTHKTQCTASSYFMQFLTMEIEMMHRALAEKWI